MDTNLSLIWAEQLQGQVDCQWTHEGYAYVCNVHCGYTDAGGE